MTSVAVSQLVMPAVVGWLLMTAPGPMGASAPGTRSLDMADILTREVPSEPCVSPDGVVVAFVVSRADTHLNRRVGDVWSVRIDSKTMAPRQKTRWTETPDIETELRWAPIGHVLGFRSRLNRGSGVDGTRVDSSAAARSQVWIQRMPAGAPLRLTNGLEGVESYRWLHDGSGVIYKTRESLSTTESRQRVVERRRGFDGVTAGADSRPFEFRLQPISGGDPILITTVDYGLGDWDLSPDDQRIVYATNGGDPHGEESPTDLWLFDRKDGVRRRLTTRWGPDTRPMFVADGRRILWKADQDTSITYSQEDLWVMDADGSNQRCLSGAVDVALDPVGWFQEDHGCGRILAERAMRGFNQLTELCIEPKGSSRTRGLEAFDSEFSPVVAGGRIAYISESLREWPEVWIRGMEFGLVLGLDLVSDSDLFHAPPGANPRVLTELAPAAGDPREPEFVIIQTTSSDGVITEALLALPETTIFGPGPYPTITQLHGGPYNRNTFRLRDNPTALVLASHGYLVYMPNFRGSKGYGNAFGTATKGDFAEGPCRDVMAGLDSLIARGLADSSRLGIMGGSYGGYLTMWSISQSDRFKAAVSMYGFSSLITDFGNGQSPSYELEFLGDPYWKGNRLWTELSPAWHVDRIHTPLLLLHGEHDPAVGISNSREMWTALTVLRRPVDFITYPREGHGFREPNHRIDASRRTLAWFDRWLR
ncbi:MAG: S9 family peptidase [Candidatus Eisenbacteria bacterium]|nr:S9 family peptidase [Candidatus Eisenbacteria bacterium]